MKLTQAEVGQLLIQAIKYQSDNSQMRLGQAIFNVAWIEYKEVTNSVRGTGADCFFNDNKIQAFIDAISK